MVPLRFVTVALTGYDVDSKEGNSIITWDAVNKKAIIEFMNNKIVFTANSNVFEVNGVEKNIENGVVAEIVNSRMFVPFRAIGEALGVDVDWDSTTKSAYYNK